MREKKNMKKKKLRLKPHAIDIVCLVGGLVIGDVIAALTKNVGFLKWLSHDVVFGFEEPLPLTFVIFKFAFGFSIHLNPAVVLFALLGLFAGRYLRTSGLQKKQTSMRPVEQEEEDGEDEA